MNSPHVVEACSHSYHGIDSIQQPFLNYASYLWKFIACGPSKDHSICNSAIVKDYNVVHEI